MKSGAKQLKEWMTRRGFDLEETAAFLALDPTYVSKLTNGHRKPGRDNSVKIEQLTGIPVEAWSASIDDKSDIVPARTQAEKAI